MATISKVKTPDNTVHTIADNKISSITGATVGKALTVSAVDSNGKPTGLSTTDYQIPVSSTTVSSAGLCSFLSSGGTTLFTLQLPLWSGSVT